MRRTLEEVIYECRWVKGIKDGALVSDAAIAEAIRGELSGSLREAQREAWEKGMADAKLQALGIKPLVRNPYLED